MEFLSNFIISPKALQENLALYPAKKICAMVKADAYGHNLKEIVKILKNKVCFLGVANIFEALEVKKVAPNSKILVVGKMFNLENAIKNDISLTIESFEDLIFLEKFIKNAKCLNKKVNIHIKLNTGMNRLGISNKKEFKKCLKFLGQTKFLNLEGVFTHFSTLDCDEHFFRKQFYQFEEMIKQIPSLFNPIIHLGGGEVVKFLSQKQLEKYMIRVGLRLYTYPNSILKIESQIVRLHNLPPLSRIGYSNGYITPSAKKIAVIPLGYADGINRKLSSKSKNIKIYNKNKKFLKNKTKNNIKIFVKVNGKKAEIVGNVCMDMFFADVSNIECKVGDKVIVYENSIKWAEKCQTISYEILTSLNYKRMNFRLEY